MAGKKFQFKLEAVLKLRRHETEVAKRALGQTLAEVAEARTRVERSAEELEALLRVRTATGSIPQLRLSAEMRAEALGRLDRARQELQDAQELEHSRRLALSECLSRQEAFEKLKTHQRSEFEEAREAVRQRMLDEFGLIAHARTKHAATE